MQTRIKSSFIYLANAVNDLRTNWKTLAIVLAPAIILAAVCLLPDALNLQHGLAQKFTPGAHDVGWRLAQEPYAPPMEPAPPMFSRTQIVVAHLGFLLLTLIADLLVLCTLRRARTAPALMRRGIGEAAEIFRDAIRIAPAYAWVSLLQLALPVIAVIAMQASFTVSSGSLALAIYFFLVTLMIFGGLLYLWLYFAPYALLIGGKHSFYALLYSRDLMRKRFFRVSMRIGVFLAVWSGFNSWAAIAFIVTSLIVGPVAVLTGSVWVMIFVVDLAAVIVNFSTMAFFTAAGLRLYQDLTAIMAELAEMNQPPAPPTVPLAEVSSSAAS
ncbi:MAG: hypothetical protein ABSG46_18850 [Candidatus Binataceae bacterium]|jgi:hypothetical protein